jgi:hypothetical protein
MVSFAGLNSAVLDRFASGGFSYSPDSGTPYPLAGIVTTGELAETRFPGSHFTLFARLSDFTATPRKGETIAVPAGVHGVNAGQYRVVGVTPEDAGGGGVYVGFAWVRP